MATPQENYDAAAAILAGEEAPEDRSMLQAKLRELAHLSPAGATKLASPSWLGEDHQAALLAIVNRKLV